MLKGLNWKNMLYAFLGILCPIIYDEIIKTDPSFPLSSKIFTELIIHLIGLVVGGWNIALLVLQKFVYDKYGEIYSEWIKK